MKLKTLSLLVIALITLNSCKKESTPQKEPEKFFFTYKVHINKHIVEPTIISGFYGKVMKYEGDFMPKTDTEPRQPEPVRNEIYVYTGDLKSKIDAAAIEKDAVTFYSFKKLKKAKVKPKYIVKPNKSGFYQMDLGTGEYCFLIAVKGNKGYYNGGAQLIKTEQGKLQELEMRIDYNATF